MTVLYDLLNKKKDHIHNSLWIKRTKIRTEKGLQLELLVSTFMMKKGNIMYELVRLWKMRIMLRTMPCFQI